MGGYDENVLELLWTGDIGPSHTGSVPLTREFASLVEEAHEQRAAEAELPLAPTLPVPDADSGRRNFERFDVSASNIRVVLRDEQKKDLGTGSVRDASVTGIWVQTTTPLALRDLARVEITILEGVRMEFIGRVVRSTETGFAVHLTTHDEDWRFRATFIELARRGSAVPPTIEIERTNEEGLVEFETRESDIRELRRLWEVASADIESDQMHQEFIHECIRLKRLEFALERYRELKRLQPDHEHVDGYLQQIGTILSFYTLQKTDKPKDNSKRKMIQMLIAFAILIFAAYGMVQFLVIKHGQDVEEPRPIEERTLPSDDWRRSG